MMNKWGCLRQPLRFRRLAGGKSRDFNAGMAEKSPQDCIGLG